MVVGVRHLAGEVPRRNRSQAVAGRLEISGEPIELAGSVPHRTGIAVYQLPRIMSLAKRLLVGGRPQLVGDLVAPMPHRIADTAKTHAVQNSTSTVIVSSGTTVHGQSVTFTATVSLADAGSGTPTGSVVFMDGSTHPKDLDPSWFGDSRGKWAGDTLVVDTVGFNDKFWFDGIGHPHTEKLHVIERYRRTDGGNLNYEITIDDPGAYTRPFTLYGHSPLLQNTEIMEYFCIENNQDVAHILGKGTPAKE